MYLSPGGSDLNSGLTESAPLQTFSAALALVQPGYTLELLDGDYTSATTGLPNINCWSNSHDGTQAAPITMRAKDERRAHIVGDGSAPAFWLQGCSWWVIDGLYVSDGEFSNETWPGDVFTIQQDSDIVFRRVLGVHPNSHFYSGVFDLRDSQRILIEESEGLDFLTAGVEFTNSSEVTVRRSYFRSAQAAALGNTCEQAVEVYTGARSTFENDVFDACEGVNLYGANPFPDGGSSGPSTDAGFSSANQILGCIALGRGLTEGTGYSVASSCAGITPCANPDVIAKDNLFENDVAIATSVGFAYGGGWRNTFRNTSAFDTTYNGAALDVWSENTGLSAADVTMENALSVDAGGDGFYVHQAAPLSWSVVDPDAYHWGVSAYDPSSAQSLVNPRTLAPQLGTCLVYVPAGSALQGVGVDGGDIGANIVYRYQDGALTSQKLWDSVTGAFPCGAVVPGVNDADGGSCSSVNRRVNVGVNGCPVP